MRDRERIADRPQRRYRWRCWPGRGHGVPRLLEDLPLAPALDDIIKRPEKAEIFSDPSTAYALCLCLARKVDEKNIDQVIVYLERNQPEIMATCMKEILKRRTAIKDTPAFKAWHKKYPNLDI